MGAEKRVKQGRDTKLEFRSEICTIHCMSARVAFAGLTLWFLSSAAFACSCSQLGPSRCSGLGSGVVFVGRVMEIENPPSERREDQGGVSRYHFQVEERFSGVDTNEIDVYSGRGGADC